MNPPDISKAGFAALLERAESRFGAWHLKVLRPERDRRRSELKRQYPAVARWAVFTLRAYRELLECEARERIGFYATVAHESGSSEMLSKRRLDEHRDRIMLSVGTAIGALKDDLQRAANAAPSNLPALPHELRYTHLRSEILHVVTAELRVLEADGMLAGQTEVETLAYKQVAAGAQPKPEQAGGTLPKAQEATPARHRRLPATVTSSLAARRMEAYLESTGKGQTEFAGAAQTTDRTLRSFRATGRVRRDIFDAIAKAMGTTREALLKPE